MKKILLAAIALLIGTCASFASTNWDSSAALSRVNTIGNNILKANNLPSGIVFKVSDEDHINAYANIGKEVYVFKGLLQFVQSDQELAAVLAHEVGHIVNAHCSKQTILNTAANMASSSQAVSNSKFATAAGIGKNLALLKISREDEYEADLTGAELMIKAGYDPLAMISVLNKICANSIDVFSTHPSGINRLMNIYDYLAYTQPSAVSGAFNSDSYKNAIVAISSNVEKRNANKNAVKKHEKAMKKLKEKRAKAQDKKTRTSDPWSTS
ncbi:peptidase M48, partial [Candidatus Gastranaerophilus sp. (ex Termes propinquus)]